MFQVRDVSVAVGDTIIVSHIDLDVAPGRVHALMGPNGSGKSSLAYAIAGHPAYQMRTGTITLHGTDLTGVTPDVRARAGLFLSMQYPPELAGVNVCTFLYEAYRAIHGDHMDITAFYRFAEDTAEQYAIDRSFLARSVHQGFSGGQKKQLELLQLCVLKPRLAILDEIDSGLDVDALSRVARALTLFKAASPDTSIILITHYQRILDHIMPDTVHVLMDGRIVRTGTAQLAHDIDLLGYDAI